jgi:uncharacterized protein with HEPN domain
MKKDNIVYLRHMLDAISRTEGYTTGVGVEDFMGNNMIQAAVTREIEIIGEATKKLSKDFKEKYRNIPWKKMAGMRDKLIHDYLGVDLDAVWNTVEMDVPILKDKIKKVLSKEEKS